MKKVFVILAALLVLSSTVYAFNEFTSGELNGNFWNEANKSERLYFLYGIASMNNRYSTALSVSDDMAKDKNYKDYDAIMTVVKFVNQEFSGNLVYGDVMNYIDEFYRNPQYKIIPVIDVLSYYSLMIQGKSQQVIDNVVSQQLSSYAQHPPTMLNMGAIQDYNGKRQH